MKNLLKILILVFVIVYLIFLLYSLVVPIYHYKYAYFRPDEERCRCYGFELHSYGYFDGQLGWKVPRACFGFLAQCGLIFK